MAFTVTPQPLNVPPRVRLDLDTDDAGGAFTSLTVSRDGRSLREQPFVGSASALLFDYEAPFGVPVTYTVSGEFLPTVVPDWSESWANLTNWTGSGFTVSGGKARSSVTGASIVRSASGSIQRLSVADPSFVRVEFLSSTDALVASVEVGSNVSVVGLGTSVVAGGGSFVATLDAGAISVAASNSSWSVAQSYSGTPTKVRVVSLGTSYPAGATFSTTGRSHGLALDSSGNIYVGDTENSLVRKFDPSGNQMLSFSSTGGVYSIAVDSSGNIYAGDGTNSMIRKYNAAGIQTLTISLAAFPFGLAVDSAGNIYVTDPTAKVVRKFNSAGAQTLSFSTTGGATGLTLDSSGNIYVYDDTNRRIRKYNAAGTETLSFPGGNQARGLAVDTAGNIFVADVASSAIRKYSASGTEVRSFPGAGFVDRVALDSSGNVYSTDTSNRLLRKYMVTTPSVGTMVTVPPVIAQPFSATTTATLDVPDTWLIHPSQPSLSIPIYSHESSAGVRYIEASSGEQKTSSAVSTVHRLIGRRRPVVITSGPRQADEWTLVVESMTIAAKNALRAIVDDQTPLLLRSPASVVMDLPDDWYSVGDVTVSRVEVPVITEATLTTMPLTPVDEPIVRVGALWTWGDVLTTYATWQDVLDNNATWLDVLAGPSS